MQFKFDENRPDFGGDLTIVAETPPEVIELSDHFRIFDKDKPADLMGLAAAIQAGTLTHVSKPAKRPWYLVESACDFEFTKPYLDLLEKLTGYGDQLPDMDLTPIHPKRLCHTHITVSAALEHGHYTFAVAIQSEDHNGKTAFDRAQTNALDYVEEMLGYRKSEPEYIENGNGTARRNPDYLKRHRPRPATGCDWLWKAIFTWWRNTHATPGQREALDLGDATKAKHRLSDNDWELRFHLGGAGLGLVSYGGIYTSYDEPVRFVKWEEFKQLK